MNFDQLITKELCVFLSSKTKTEAILELLDLVEKSGKVTQMDNLKKEIFYREQIMSTGIGQGIAIPHVRFEGVTDPMVIVGLAPEGIKDYSSIDDQMVHIVIMILVGAEQHKEYLRILSLIVSKLKDKTFQEGLLSAEDNVEMERILKGETGK